MIKRTLSWTLTPGPRTLPLFPDQFFNARSAVLSLARSGARTRGFLECLDRHQSGLRMLEEHVFPDPFALADGFQAFDDILLFHSFTVIPAME